MKVHPVSFRPPVRSERDAIQHAIVAREGASHGKFRVAGIKVSSVDPSWALDKTIAKGSGCEYHLWHREHGHWTYVTGGSGGYLETPKLPAKVKADLEKASFGSSCMY